MSTHAPAFTKNYLEIMLIRIFYPNGYGWGFAIPYIEVTPLTQVFSTCACKEASVFYLRNLLYNIVFFSRHVTGRKVRNKRYSFC
jgi:hypothetical protein